jgi:SPOR domain
LGFSLAMQVSGITRLVLALGLGLSLPGLWAQPEAAFAQSSEPGLSSVSKALQAYEAGDYDVASSSLDEAFKAGLSKELSARAILLRAQIHERNGALARALQDYSNALWMDILPSADRKKAADGKRRVIAAMGLNTSPPKANSVTGQASAGGSSAPQTPPAEAQSMFGMLSGLFGSEEQKSTASAPAPPASEAPQKAWQTATAEQAAAPPQVNVAIAAPPPKPRTARAEKPPAAAKAHPPGPVQPVSMTPAAADGFLIVFGPASTETAGRARAREIKAQLSDILVSRELDLEGIAAGGYRIVAGPYKAKSAALALCRAIKQRGIACEVTP